MKIALLGWRFSCALVVTVVLIFKNWGTPPSLVGHITCSLPTMAHSLAGGCAPGDSLDARFLKSGPDFASVKQECVCTRWMWTTRPAASHSWQL